MTVDIDAAALREIPANGAAPPHSWLLAPAWSPGGDTIAVVGQKLLASGFFDSTLWLVDVATASWRAEYQTESLLNSLSWSPDGSYLAFAEGRGAAATGDRVAVVLTLATREINDVAHDVAGLHFRADETLLYFELSETGGHRTRLMHTRVRSGTPAQVASVDVRPISAPATPACSS